MNLVLQIVLALKKQVRFEHNEISLKTLLSIYVYIIILYIIYSFK